jgi:hypothetical protein
MLQVSTIVNNSLSVALGLIIYSFIIYLGYLMFFSSSLTNPEIEEEQKDAKKEERKEDREKIDTFDILEDA